MSRKRKQPKLTELIGRVRKSNLDAVYAVNWAKHNAETSLLKQFVDWLAQSPHLKLLVGDSAFPKEYAEIHSRIPRLMCSRDWKLELRWNLLILKKFAPKLAQYIQLRSTFGRHLLLGDYSFAEEALDKVESAISKSLWSLDKRFLLLQYRDGFLGNKEYLGQLHDTCRNQYVNLLALFFSLRVERAIDLFSYRHLVETKLAEIQKHGDSPTEAYFRSVLLADSSFDPEYASYILFLSNDASIIDRLNATVRTLRQVLRTPDGVNELNLFRDSIRDLAKATMDPSLLAIDRFLRPTEQCILPDDYGEFLSALDLYTEGKYDEAIPRFRCFIERHPAAFHPYVVCAKAHAFLGQDTQPLGESLSIASQILDSLARVMSGKGDVRERIYKLFGIAVDLGENHLAFGLISFVYDLLGQPDGNTAALIEHSSKFPNLAEESTATDGAVRIAHLLKLFPDSVTLRFLECRSRNALSSEGQSLAISSSRLNFYTAEEQITTGGDPVRGVLDLEGLFSAAECRESVSFAELHQITQSLFRAYVELKQYDNACRVAIRAYIINEILAGSLDFSGLLKIFSGLAPTSRGNIYIPIVTFFSGRSDFEIHKALDRFLRSHRCSRMSEILKLADHFPPDAFEVLTGEVMSENVMSLGWRYTQDLEDVETQRVELCAYLVSSLRKGAGEYAEEAKAVIKRQSIRRALRHVRASKLRIDFTRIKQFYKKSMEPIYNRRLLFIEAERHGKLVQIDTDQLIRAAIAAGSAEAEAGEMRPEVSTELTQESQNLLHLLLVQCYAAFLWEAEGNLNFLLSAEVRHGFLKNHLRKPFQAHNVILGKDTSEGNYRSSDYWIRHFEGNLTLEALAAIDEEFQNFSTLIDDLIHSLNNKIVQIRLSDVEQVRLEDVGMGERLKGSDEGYFDYTSFFSSILAKTADLDATLSFDAFADICFGELEKLTKRNLSRVRDYFQNDVPKVIRDACEKLVEGLRDHIDKPYLWTAVLTAVQNARDEAISESNEIASWFQPANEEQPSDTNLGEVADIVATLLRSCHPKSLGHCQISYDQDGEKISVNGSSFSAVFDSLYILLQNVAEHSELPSSDVWCTISIRAESGNAVISVANNVSDEAAAQRKTALALRSLEEQSQFAAEGEGRSGLRKISRIFSNVVGCPPPTVNVSYSGRRVSVELVLPKNCTLI